MASASAAITKLARSAFPDLECRPPLRFVIWVMLFALHKNKLHEKSLDQHMPLIVCLFDMGNVDTSGKAFENKINKKEVFFSSTKTVAEALYSNDNFVLNAMKEDIFNPQCFNVDESTSFKTILNKNLTDNALKVVTNPETPVVQDEATPSSEGLPKQVPTNPPIQPRRSARESRKGNGETNKDGNEGAKHRGVKRKAKDDTARTQRKRKAMVSGDDTTYSSNLIRRRACSRLLTRKLIPTASIKEARRSLLSFIADCGVETGQDERVCGICLSAYFYHLHEKGKVEWNASTTHSPENIMAQDGFWHCNDCGLDVHASCMRYFQGLDEAYENKDCLCDKKDPTQWIVYCSSDVCPRDDGKLAFRSINAEVGESEDAHEVASFLVHARKPDEDDANRPNISSKPSAETSKFTDAMLDDNALLADLQCAKMFAYDALLEEEVKSGSVPALAALQCPRQQAVRSDMVDEAMEVDEPIHDIGDVSCPGCEAIQQPALKDDASDAVKTHHNTFKEDYVSDFNAQTFKSETNKGYMSIVRNLEVTNRIPRFLVR